MAEPPSTSGQSTLDAYGWSAEVGHLLAGLDVRGAPARVVRTDRVAVLVAARQGLFQVDIPLGLEPTPVAGDWLVLAGTPPRIVGVAPRRNSLARRDEQQSQTLASGVDEAFVVCGLDRPLVTGLLDRALVVACDAGARPAVILTKADLCEDATGVAAELAATLPGVDVLVTSCRDGRGLGDVRGRFSSRRTIALLGESGVGKSSLVNALAETAAQPTAEVRARDRQGRHTTGARRLIPVGGGAVVIDTPGLRTFGIVGMGEGLRRLFSDVEEIAMGCRFSDCQHTAEPDCAVVAAVAAGTLDRARADRYHRLSVAVGSQGPRGRGVPSGRRGRRRPAP